MSDTVTYWSGESVRIVCQQLTKMGSIVVLKDASSVRATHPIPASCGLYYFEVKIVSKGRDGYMGVGLSAHDVNMNRYLTVLLCPVFCIHIGDWSILIRFQHFRSVLIWIRTWIKFTAERNSISYFVEKNCNNVPIFSLSFYEGRPSYRRSLQPSKGNI